MPRRSPSHSPSPTSTSTYAKSPPLTIVRLKLPPSQSEQGSSNVMKWSFSIIQMENLHKQTSAQKKTNGNKPWKIKKPKRKFTRARHCRCAVAPLPFAIPCLAPLLYQPEISHKSRRTKSQRATSLRLPLPPSLCCCQNEEDNAIAKPMKCFNFLPQTSQFG